MQDIAKTLKYDGDAIAQFFIYALEDANFHTEAKVIQSIWEAMASTPYRDSRDSQKLVDAAVSVLNKLLIEV